MSLLRCSFQRLAKFPVSSTIGVNKLHLSVGEDELSAQVIKRVEEGRRKSDTMDLIVRLQVGLNALERTGRSTAGKAGPREVEHEVKAFGCNGNRGDRNAAAVAVKRCANSAQASHEGWDEVFGIRQVVQGHVSQPFVFFSVRRLCNSPSGFGFHGGSGLGGILRHQIIVHAPGKVCSPSILAFDAVSTTVLAPVPRNYIP